jgi:hypothetical protein
MKRLEDVAVVRAGLSEAYSITINLADKTHF